MILIKTVGLPKSGKSTLARRLGFPIVSLDAIRLYFNGIKRYVAATEPQVMHHAKVMCHSLMHAGHKYIIVDSCATTRAKRDEWRHEYWKIQFAVLDVPAWICIERAMACHEYHLIEAINQRARDWEDLLQGDVEYVI